MKLPKFNSETYAKGVAILLVALWCEIGMINYDAGIGIGLGLFVVALCIVSIATFEEREKQINEERHRREREEFKRQWDEYRLKEEEERKAIIIDQIVKTEARERGWGPYRAE